MSLQTITPCLLLDWQRMERNIERMAAHMSELGVPLRPHLKTCKNIEIGRLMVRGQPGGITVSTLAEADYFFEHGMNDILYAVGIAPGKLPAVAERMLRGMQLTIILDHTETARSVASAARETGTSFRVMIEIDADGERAGFAPDDGELVNAAKILVSAGCRVAGVMVHAGGSYHSADRAAIEAMAETERQAVVTAALRLRQDGMETPIVSAGSTPTATFARNLDGVTEFRAGVHVFQDLVQAGLGVCDIDDIAISVLTEVIGHRRHEGQVLVDAGWMALSRDRSTAGQAVDQGYGLVCDEQGNVCDGVIVVATNQEHGIVGRRDGAALDLSIFPLGQRLRILPNHACATAAQHRGYHVLDNGQADGRWLERCHGW